MTATRVSDLTVAELHELIRSVVQEVLDERDLKKPLRSPSVQAPPNPREILNLPPLSVGTWPEGLKLLSREEYYNDDGR